MSTGTNPPPVLNPQPKPPQAATPVRRIIEAIEKDILGREGLRQEWVQIDDDQKEEIFEAWEEIIRSGGKTKPAI